MAKTSKTNDTDYYLGLIDKINEDIKVIYERIELNAKRIDSLSEGLDNHDNTLKIVKNRMGL